MEISCLLPILHCLPACQSEQHNTRIENKMEFQSLEKIMMWVFDSVPYVYVVFVSFSEDKSWYRAAVLKEYSNKEYQLEYVEFGNGERVALDLMRPITEELAAFPRQSVKCCLAGETMG